jgi:hypothetical protein
MEWKRASEKERLPYLSPKNGKIKEGENKMRFKLADPEPGMVTKWILLVIALLIGVILVPIVVNQVQTTSTSGWNFTGYQGAKTLFYLLPFIFIIGIVVYFIASMLGKI